MSSWGAWNRAGTSLKFGWVRRAKTPTPFEHRKSRGRKRRIDFGKIQSVQQIGNGFEWIFNFRKNKVLCALSSLNLFTFTWSVWFYSPRYKDWKPLTESSRHKIQWIEPDHCVLTIGDCIGRDEGLYSVTARNIAGK
jgi:hypothetical protein